MTHQVYDELELANPTLVYASVYVSVWAPDMHRGLNEAGKSVCCKSLTAITAV